MVQISSLAVLLADLTGSTPLYEAVGNARAAEIVAACRDTMRAAAEHEGGRFIHYRGDDVLCVFEDVEAAMRAARAIVRTGGGDAPGVHAGLTWGEIVMGRDEVFGDAVNLAARLSAVANPGEVLMSGDFVERLSDGARMRLRPMDKLALKGKALPVEVFGALGQELDSPTTVIPVQVSNVATLVSLSVAGEDYAVVEGREVVIGRGLDCEIVMGAPHISRRHAAISVRQGLVEFIDYSSTGSFVKFGDADPFYIRRKPVVLSGVGAISLGIDMGEARESLIWFKVASDN